MRAFLAPAALARRSFSHRVDLGVLIILLLVAFWLRVHRLGDANIWWDEGYSVYLARKGLLAIALETAGDVHPPLHYWLLHFWMRLVGEGEFAVRYSSLWFGVLAVPLIYWLGRRLLNPPIALFAALLLATARFHVDWSQQIRMYTLVTVLAMLSMALTVRLWSAPRRQLWIAYVAVTTVGLYTLYLSGLVPLIESLVVLLLCSLPLGGRRLGFDFLLRWLIAQVVTLLLFAPWVKLFLGIPRATPAVLFPIDLFTFLQASATAFPLGVSAYLDRYTAATVAALALFALALPAVARPDLRRTGLLLYALVIVPPFVVYALSFPNPVLYAPNLSVRYLLIFLPAYYLLLSAATWLASQPAVDLIRSTVTRSESLSAAGRGGWLEPLLRAIAWRPLALEQNQNAGSERLSAGRSAGWPRRWVGRAFVTIPSLLAVIFLVGAALWSLEDYYSGRRLRDDFQTVVHYLNAYVRPNDAIVLSSDKDWAIFRYYFAGNETVRGISYNNNKPVTSAEASEFLAPLIRDHGSIWLLTSYDAFDSDPTGVAPAWLGAHARLAGEVAGDHRRIALYTTDPGRSLLNVVNADPMQQMAATFTVGLKLNGYDLSNREVMPGEPVRFAAYWQAAAPLAAETVAELRLFDRNGVVYRDARAPVRSSFAPESLPAGATVRGDYTLALPKTMPAGEYTLALGVVAAGRELTLAGANQVTVPLQKIRVLGNVSVFPRPAPQHPLTVSLGERLSLVGYDLSLGPLPLSSTTPPRGELQRGGLIHLRLYWQAREAIAQSYTVFVQLVGAKTNPATGNVVWSQRDALPQQGARPSDSWLPDEAVSDDYALAVPTDAPAGAYYVQVGLYDQGTGQRLAVKGAESSPDSVVVFEGLLK